jgi:hypothetical protein
MGDSQSTGVQMPLNGLRAWLWLDGWAGRIKQAVLIIGETPKRYRITPAGTDRVRLAGRYRWLAPGDSALVPKRAVTLATDANRDG